MTGERGLFAPVCSITKTKRRRFFWAAWWSGPPAASPFRKPDASGGGAASLEEALAAAEARAGAPLLLIEPGWARAVIRILRGEPASSAVRELRAPAPKRPARQEPERSIWEELGVGRDVDEVGLKDAYRRRALETHPDQGGDPAAFMRVVRAYDEARRRIARPRARR